MFNLGYRQVVLNNLADVEAITAATGVATGIAAVVTDYVSIPGFGKFVVRAAATDAATNWAADAVAATRAKVTVTGPAATLAGNAYNVRIFFTATERPLSEIFPERGSGGLMYQSGILAANDKLGDALVAGAVVGNFNDIIGTFTNSGTANNFIFEMNAGYEGINVERIEITNAADADARPTNLAFVNTVLGTVGVGLGKQVEAEVRNATFDNVDPYGIQFGGNQAVDVRGTYATLKFSMAAQEDSPGWEPHAPLGREDANVATSYANRDYIMYVNTALLTAGVVATPGGQSVGVQNLLAIVSGL